MQRESVMDIVIFCFCLRFQKKNCMETNEIVKLSKNNEQRTNLPLFFFRKADPLYELSKFIRKTKIKKKKKLCLNSTFTNVCVST